MLPKVVFKRKIYDQLLEWKRSPSRNSALLIEGARRVGKSTLVEQFAENEYEDYLIIDFRKESSYVKSLFNDVKDINAFYRKLFITQNHILKPGGLIVFDEVQFCPKARESIKDFVADGRYDFIETGSLISIKENTQDIMIPSEERRIDMFPMDFEEYLLASEGNDSFLLLKNILEEKAGIDPEIHERYMEKFRMYMLIGGMPKVLSTFLSTNSFKAAEEEKLDILKLYRDDLRKHDRKYETECGAIFDAIPAQLAKDNRRFVISSVPGNSRYDNIMKSLSDLCDFKIVNRVDSVSVPESPLGLNVEQERFKLYFCDTGLLFSKLALLSGERLDQAYLNFIKGKSSANVGSIFESAVVQQLVLSGVDVYFHRFQLVDETGMKKGEYELDVIFEKGFKVTVAEVKSSKNYTTSSLDSIKKKYPQLKTRKIVLGPKNAKYESDKTTYPIYLVPFL